ncbi:hypothetical protein HK102_009166, partial [Quaeritorhiza haematococci]
KPGRSKSLARSRYEESPLVGEPEKEAPVDENIIVPDYVRALIAKLRSDPTMTPTPEDFFSSEGFPQWRQSMNQTTFQEVLCDLLKARYLDPTRKKKETTKDAKDSKDSAAGGGVVVDLFFKVVEARGLLAKEGKSRDPYIQIAYGPLPEDFDPSTYNPKKDPIAGVEMFQTETLPSTLNPVFNQHVTVPAKNLQDRIVLAVWDKRKDEFLGLVSVGMSEVITGVAKEGYIRRWYKLGPRSGDKKGKDKYVGGEVLIEAQMKDNGNNPLASNSKSAGRSNPETIGMSELAARASFVQSQLITCKASFKSLYKTLLRNCLMLDMETFASSITPSTIELLSEESKTLLKVYGGRASGGAAGGVGGAGWAVGDAFQVIAYLELLFEKYKSYEVPENALMNALETVHSMKRKSGWLSSLEKPILVELLEQMYSYYRTQVTKYKEFYPKNQPRGALETTILMLRMIHKNPIYRESHPKLPESFREELRLIMNEAAISRYSKLQELSSPFDESDTEAVIEGLKKLAELLSEEIEADSKYFAKPFAREVDITRLTAENYLRMFVQTLEESREVISSDEAVGNASKSVFALYKRVRVMDERYARLVPGLRRLSMNNTGFNVERWFAPFVTKWLDNLSTRTLEWVTNAVK